MWRRVSCADGAGRGAQGCGALSGRAAAQRRRVSHAACQRVRGHAWDVHWPCTRSAHRTSQETAAGRARRASRLRLHCALCGSARWRQRRACSRSGVARACSKLARRWAADPRAAPPRAAPVHPAQLGSERGARAWSAGGGWETELPGESKCRRWMTWRDVAIGWLVTSRWRSGDGRRVGGGRCSSRSVSCASPAANSKARLPHATATASGMKGGASRRARSAPASLRRRYVAPASAPTSQLQQRRGVAIRRDCQALSDASNADTRRAAASPGGSTPPRRSAAGIGPAGAPHGNASASTRVVAGARAATAFVRGRPLARRRATPGVALLRRKAPGEAAARGDDPVPRADVSRPARRASSATLLRVRYGKRPLVCAAAAAARYRLRTRRGAAWGTRASPRRRRLCADQRGASGGA